MTGFPDEPSSVFTVGRRLQLERQARPLSSCPQCRLQRVSRRNGGQNTVKSVADYLPETVVVELADGSREHATCYNLPAGDVAGTNQAYARSLLDLAYRLELPDSYIREIRSFIDS